MAETILQLRAQNGDIYKRCLPPLVAGIKELLDECEEAVLAFCAALAGSGDPALFDPQVRDCACQTRACIVLRLLRSPPQEGTLEGFLEVVREKREQLRTSEYYCSTMNKKEKLGKFCERNSLNLFSGENSHRDQILRFIVISYILTKYKRSGYFGGVYKDTLETNLPKAKARVLKRLQGWLSAFSVDFVASVNPLSRLMVVEKNTLTVLPCYLTAVALADLWDLEPKETPMIMKLTVRRFCQEGVYGYHDHDSFFSWSSAGVHVIAPRDVETGTHVIQFFSVSVNGDVSVLEKIRTNLLAPCASDEGRQPNAAEGAPSGASLGGSPCPHGSTCADFVEWRERIASVNFREVFFTVCATHPQYPGTHYSQMSQEWVDLCAEHSPELYTAFLASLDKKTTLACHRGNLDLFMYEHITAAVHRC